MMTRSRWKGHISFGLITMPVMLYSLINKSTNICFHQIDKRDHARIKYQRFNSNTGKIVSSANIMRGYELDKLTMIPISNTILKKIAGKNAKSIQISNFIDKKSLNLLTLKNVYYIVPTKKSLKAYVILRNSLAEMGKVGIAKMIISTREYLTAVLPHDKALVVCLLYYDNEMIKPAEFDLPDIDAAQYHVTVEEMKAAKQLITSMSAKWHPENYRDEYQQSIHRLVNEAVSLLPQQDQFIKKEKTVKKIGKVVDFVELLKMSLATTVKKRNKSSTAISSKSHKLNKSKNKVLHPRTAH